MDMLRTSLVIQWLKFQAPNAGISGSILGQGTKILHATTRTRYGQINKNKYFKKINK